MKPESVDRHLNHWPVTGSCRKRSEPPYGFTSVTKICHPGHQTPLDCSTNVFDEPSLIILDHAPVSRLKRKTSVSRFASKFAGSTDHPGAHWPWLSWTNPPSSSLSCRDQ